MPVVNRLLPCPPRMAGAELFVHVGAPFRLAPHACMRRVAPHAVAKPLDKVACGPRPLSGIWLPRRRA